MFAFVIISAFQKLSNNFVCCQHPLPTILSQTILLISFTLPRQHCAAIFPLACHLPYHQSQMCLFIHPINNGSIHITIMRASVAFSKAFHICTGAALWVQIVPRKDCTLCLLHCCNHLATLRVPSRLKVGAKIYFAII